jgi:hypothetical protein
MRLRVKPLPTIVIAALLLISVQISTGALVLTQTADPIESIRQQYAIINKGMAGYKTVKKQLSGFSAEGGELIAYFEGQSIMLITATYYGEMGKTVEEYYYWRERPIFVLRTELRYDKSFSSKVVRTTDSRFYFANNRLIRWIDENQKQMKPGSDEYQKNQDEYLASARKFARAARSKARTIEA